MRKYRINKNDGIRHLLIVFLMITLGAVIIGYFGTRYFIYPILIKESDAQLTNIEEHDQGTVPQANEPVQQLKEAEELAEPEKNINAFYIYHVQLGNFSTEKNADSLINRLEEDNIYAYVFEDDGFKVVTTPVIDYNQAEVIKDNLLAYAEDAFIFKRQIQVDNVSVETTITNILNDLREAHSQPDSNQWIKKLKGAFQDGLGDSQMKQETIQAFQSIYDEVNQIDAWENNLFDIEKRIIIMIEEIIS